jgi:hypothetical protein
MPKPLHPTRVRLIFTSTTYSIAADFFPSKRCDGTFLVIEAKTNFFLTASLSPLRFHATNNRRV